MPFIPDEQEKTVKIPIQVRGGRIQFYFDGPLPLLEEGVIGDLVVPYYALRRKDVATSGDISNQTLTNTVANDFGNSLHDVVTAERFC